MSSCSVSSSNELYILLKSPLWGILSSFSILSPALEILLSEICFLEALFFLQGSVFQFPAQLVDWGQGNR